MINLANEPVRDYSKKKQLTNNRITPLARKRGAISTKVRKQLYERSQGKCEREECQHKAVHAAHTERRWQLSKTTVNVLLHLCLGCHHWADNTGAGREWLKVKREEAK